MKYKAIVGGNYPKPGRPRTGPGSTDEVRFEAGDILTSLPVSVEAALLELQAIEPYSGAVTSVPKGVAGTISDLAEPDAA